MLRALRQANLHILALYLFDLPFFCFYFLISFFLYQISDHVDEEVQAQS
jgi:hypothetical protein